MGSVISAAVDVISGLFKITSLGIVIAPPALFFSLFLKAMQPQTYQLSSLEGISNSFIHGKAHHTDKRLRGTKTTPFGLKK